MLSLLDDESTYRILNRDLTKCIERRLNSFICNLFKSQRITQINFTIELEQDDKLAFLDVLVMRTQNGKLATKVHR